MQADVGGAEARGWHVVACDSTQDLMRAWVADAARSAGDVGAVVADHQHCGRGRGGRSWNDRPGMALLMSVGIVGPIECGSLDSLTVRAAGAVRDAIQQQLPFGCAITVQSPNDLVVAGRKLGGLLADTHLVGPEVRWVVVGVGVNLLGEHFEIDGRAATSVRAASGVVIEPWQLAEDVVGAVAAEVGVGVARVSWERE